MGLSFLSAAERQELVVTTVVTSAVVFVAFALLHGVLPEPAIEGRACVLDELGEPAYQQCVRSWFTSQSDRTVFRIAVGLAVTFVSTLTVVWAERRNRIPGVRTSLALALAAGFALAMAVVVQGWAGAAYLGGGALFGLAAVLPAQRATAAQFLIAVGLGAALWVVSFFTYFVVFYEAH